MIVGFLGCFGFTFPFLLFSGRFLAERTMERFTGTFIKGPFSCLKLLSKGSCVTTESSDTRKKSFCVKTQNYNCFHLLAGNAKCHINALHYKNIIYMIKHVKVLQYLECSLNKVAIDSHFCKLITWKPLWLDHWVPVIPNKFRN